MEWSPAIPEILATFTAYPPSLFSRSHDASDSQRDQMYCLSDQLLDKWADTALLEWLRFNAFKPKSNSVSPAKCCLRPRYWLPSHLPASHLLSTQLHSIYPIPWTDPSWSQDPRILPDVAAFQEINVGQHPWNGQPSTGLSVVSSSLRYL